MCNLFYRVHKKVSASSSSYDNVPKARQKSPEPKQKTSLTETRVVKPVNRSKSRSSQKSVTSPQVIKRTEIQPSSPRVKDDQKFQPVS